MSRESKPFYRVSCDGCKAVLDDGEHWWWDLESVDPVMQASGWRSFGTHDRCWDCWVQCDYCDEPMPMEKGDVCDLRACAVCDLKHARCGESNGHQYADEGYENVHGGWVEVITCMLCGHVQREGVKGG